MQNHVIENFMVSGWDEMTPAGEVLCCVLCVGVELKLTIWSEECYLFWHSNITEQVHQNIETKKQIFSIIATDHRMKLLDKTKTDCLPKQQLDSVIMLYMPFKSQPKQKFSQSPVMYISKCDFGLALKADLLPLRICLSRQFISRKYWPTSHVLSHCGESSIVECGRWAGCRWPHVASWESVQKVCVKSLVIVNT